MDCPILRIIKLFFSRAKATTHNELCSCFVNLSFTHESVFPLISYIVKDEFETNSKGQVLRENCLASKIIKTYLEKIGKDYLIEVLGKHINSIAYSERKMSFEIDPSKADAVECEKNRPLLEGRASDILNSIFESIDKMPIGIRMIARIVAEQAQLHLPDQVNILIGSFLFLRFLNPALFSPENTEGLLKGKLPSNTARRNLILITKLLQNLSNEKTFSSKEPYMKGLEGFINKNKATLADFYKKLTDFRYNPSTVHDLTNHSVSAEDLQYFHSILFQSDDLNSHFKNKNHSNLFTQMLEKLGSYKNKTSITELEESDQKVVRSIIESKNEEVSYACLLELTTDKKKKNNNKVGIVLVVGRNKIFFIKSKENKIVNEFHLVDLLEVISEKVVNELSITFRNNAEKTENVPTTKILTADPEKIDDIINVIRRVYNFTFHCDGFKIKVKPESRLKPTSSLAVGLPYCSGLVQTYKSLCVYYDLPVNLSVCYGLEHYYLRNRTLHFDSFTTLSEAPLTDKDAQPLFHALGYNRYFTSLIVKHMKFDKNTADALSKMLSINTTLTNVTLSDVSVRERGHFFGFFDALESNKDTSVISLDLQGMILETKKDRDGLAYFLTKVNTNFIRLDLSQPTHNKGEDRKAPTTKEKDSHLKQVLPALSHNPVFTDHLAILNLSGNKIDSESLDLLTKFLKKAEALEVLQLAGTRLNLHGLMRGLAGVKCSESLCVLDLSNQKLLEVGHWELMLSWLESPNLFGLQSLDISNTFIPIESFVRILQYRNKNIHSENRLSLRAAKNNLGKDGAVSIGAIAYNCISLISLDLSDNNMGDEGVLSLVEGFYHNACLNQLNLGRNFRFQTIEKRTRMIQAMKEMLNSPTLKLASLLIAGANKGNNKDSRLKEAIVPLFSALAQNTTLTDLDINGHAAGTSGAISLARMLEVNNTLMRLSWDDNNTGLLGLQNFYKSLKLNRSLVEMPMPLSDISKLAAVHAHVTSPLQGMGGSEKEARKLFEVVEGIEGLLRRNQQY